MTECFSFGLSACHVKALQRGMHASMRGMHASMRIRDMSHELAALCSRSKSVGCFRKSHERCAILFQKSFKM